MTSNKKLHEKRDYTVNEAWELIFDKYDIVRRVKEDGFFRIKADEIKEFKEPRLMSKWDSSEQLPRIFKDKKLNILPDSRNSYIMSDFLLYETIPEIREHSKTMPYVELPNFETIDVENISSEASAINILVLSNILEDFLETSENVLTFNGRMGTGTFDFSVATISGTQQVNVSNAQCEIDGGFENEESVVIMEAKNVIHSDFHIRQLYYPYRLWKAKVRKPIRLVFSVYSNKIFRLFEYKFEDPSNYSSIKLVRSKYYSLFDTSITIEEIIAVRNQTVIKYDDNQNRNGLPPFIQADSFERIISLLENMYDNPMTDEEIASLMQFGVNYQAGNPAFRQSQYYYNAGKYLGLFEKEKVGKKVVSKLTKLGEKVYKLPYKARQLKLVSLIFEHRIFAEMFDLTILNNGSLPSRDTIINRMIALNVCNEGQIERRSSSVISWLEWVLKLTKL